MEELLKAIVVLAGMHGTDEDRVDLKDQAISARDNLSDAVGEILGPVFNDLLDSFTKRTARSDALYFETLTHAYPHLDSEDMVALRIAHIGATNRAIHEGLNNSNLKKS